MLAFEIVEAHASKDKLANELLWYVDPEYRGQGIKFLTFVEKELTLTGVKAITMSHMGNLNNRLYKIYKRFGYELLQSTYIKRL